MSIRFIVIYFKIFFSLMSLEVYKFYWLFKVFALYFVDCSCFISGFIFIDLWFYSIICFHMLLIFYLLFFLVSWVQAYIVAFTLNKNILWKMSNFHWSMREYHNDSPTSMIINTSPNLLPSLLPNWHPCW